MPAPLQSRLLLQSLEAVHLVEVDDLAAENVWNNFGCFAAPRQGTSLGERDAYIAVLAIDAVVHAPSLHPGNRVSLVAF
ncbi:MAG TPA: hypothetical protein VK694_04690 [Verrucomicrobiae bacterium]|nr:hypothetical protein [Verrucomicrobiae bacterium]